MYRVCAAGAFLLCLLALGSCGSTVSSAFDAPVDSRSASFLLPLPEVAHARENLPGLNVQLTWQGPLLCGSKWYADQD
jgi:hypothetical protein